MTEKTYLEYVDEKSSKFWELTLNGTSFTVRYGKIGSDGRESPKAFDTEEEAREAAEKLIDSKMKKGYVTASSGSNPEPRESTFAEVVDTYAPLRSPGVEPLAQMAEIATIYDGDVTWDGHSITSLAAERGDQGTIMIVDGDLTFTNDSVGWDRDQDFENNVLVVTGKLKANGLFLHDIGAVEVMGDLEVKVLYGGYGDNGGTLNVGGKTTAGLIVAETYFVFGFEGGVDVDVIVGDSTYATDWTEDYIDTEDVEHFVDEVVEGGEASGELVYERFLAGEPILTSQ